MFNDKFLLTQAVMDGTKTMTRRIVDVPTECVFKTIADIQGSIIHAVGYDEKPVFRWETRYQIGEVVAIAQCYLDIKKPQFDKFGHDVAGNTNKMFVRADLMPHHIKITNVKVERLQDISDDDCLKEGIRKATIGYYVDGLMVRDWQKESHRETESGNIKLFPTPKLAYASLINKICGKGTWERNPWVEAYTFTRVD